MICLLLFIKVNDELRTDKQRIEREILAQLPGGPEEVLAVITTTSCFAPRAVGELVVIELCLLATPRRCVMAQAGLWRCQKGGVTCQLHRPFLAPRH